MKVGVLKENKRERERERGEREIDITNSKRIKKDLNIVIFL